MKALVLYNSYSGKGKLLKSLDIIRQELKDTFLITWFDSTGPKSITKYIVANGKAFDIIIACGGDGTVHEAINGIMRLNKAIKFAVIPMGTCNDLAKTLGMSKRIKKSIKIIKSLNSARMDVSKVNDDYFIYGLAAGSLTEISYEAPHSTKKILGKLAYYFSVLGRINKYERLSFNIRLDDKRLDNEELAIFLATNTRYLAGFKLFGKQKPYLNDNKLSILLIKRINRFHAVALFLKALLIGRYSSKYARFIEARSISIKSVRDVNFNTDGELLGSERGIEVNVIPSSLEVICTPKVKEKYFLKETS